MRVDVILNRTRLWRWQSGLIASLSALGHHVTAFAAEYDEPLPTSFSVALDIDRAIAPFDRERPSDKVAAEPFKLQSPVKETAADAIIDLSGHTLHRPNRGVRVLFPTYDGEQDDDYLWLALLDHRAPLVEVADTASENPWATALPALEQPWRLSKCADAVAERVSALLIATIEAVAAGREPPACAETVSDYQKPPHTPAILASTRHFAKRSQRKVRAALSKFTGQKDKWAVAWRVLDSEAYTPASAILQLADYHLIEDDGHRYYADPFIFERNAERFVFVEEFPYDTGKGIISVLSFDKGNRPSSVRPVLDVAHHLSYPQVFVRDGQIWMLPEGAAGGGLDLYRAVDFPNRWTLERRIIDEPLHDATLFDFAGQLWITATGGQEAGAPWDALRIYSAPSLIGPWTAHRDNPIMFDARAARPAGPIIKKGDKMWRPVQDCSKAYGGALMFAEVTELTTSAFRQSISAKLSFAPESRLLGPHTWSRAAGLEVIDVCGTPAAISAGLRGSKTL